MPLPSDVPPSPLDSPVPFTAPVTGRVCSAASVHAGEPLAGTAPHRRAWVLVEHPGPWGQDPLTDAPWPDGIGDHLRADSEAAGVRVLAVRRHDATPLGGPAERPFVALCFTGPDGWAVSRRLDSPMQLRGLPLAVLASGIRPNDHAPTGDGWTEAGQLWGVCTHGTRDACCARLGRPLADRLTAADPEHTWEISHSGGHRLAPVVLSWPEGLVYGRIPDDRLPEVMDARARGHVVLDLVRGQVWLGEPQQAGEIALRRHLGLTALDAVRPDFDVPQPEALVGTRPDGDSASAGRSASAAGSTPVVVTRWRVDGQRWQVEVRNVTLPDRPASCGKSPESARAWQASRPTSLPELAGAASEW